MLYGYIGKMLFVDLSKKIIEEKELPEDLVRDFIGGYGIGAKILYDNMPAGTDPLGPESILGFVSGLANGTKAFFGGRYTMVHKSPVTGGWNDANSGGYFGPELKKAGYDALFISGKSDSPVYLWIGDGKAQIRDASGLWGKSTKETQELLKTETGEQKLRVLSIGPSGEKMALLSCPINDGHRALGRGGGGAVMGSKMLKAVAVRGTGTVEAANPDKVVEINKRISEFMKESPVANAFAEYGTGVGTAASALNGDSPVKNWKGAGTVDFGEEKAQMISTLALDKYKVKKYNCSNCPLGCGAEYEVNEGRWPVGRTDRPEYETLAAFGSTLLCGESDALIKCNDICNLYGLDTISSGMTIAWAMECYNKGILSRDELDGIALDWGNGEAIVELMQKMADCEGCGAILANGSAYSAKYWGKGEEFLQTASGIELPMHDPRFAPGLARTYQYDPTPGRHVKGGIGALQMGGNEISYKYDYNGTGSFDLQLTANTEVMNSGGFCMFHSLASPQGVQNELIEAITGMKFDNLVSYTTGLRILNLRHAFNLREGLKPQNFTITQRAVGNPPLKEGPLSGVTVNNELLKDNFFEAAGWDKQTGKPSLDVLMGIGHLEDVIEDLYGVTQLA